MRSALMWCGPRDIICTICQDYFTDPVTIFCGHSFCTPCLCLFWEGAQAPTRCPECRAIAQQMDFKGTIFAKKQVLSIGGSIFNWLPGFPEQICSMHQAIKNVFCPADKSLVCYLCCYSPAHASHRHYQAKQAAELCRENILIKMKSIWKNKQKNQRNIIKETKIFRGWEMMMIRAEYPQVYRYLHEELQKHLESLELEGRRLLQLLKENIAEMVETGKNLRRIYVQLKELVCKADVDLLQDAGDTEIRAELVQLKMPQSMDPQLTARTITGLMERLNYFRVCIALEDKISTYDLPLFEELKRHMQCRPDYQDMPPNPAPLEFTAFWGTPTFTSGKHYWEMDVGNSCNWIIGLCKESWTARYTMQLNTNGIFLLLCVNVDDHFSLFSTSPLIHQYIQRPQGRIGVFLDYDFGIISFVNVAQGSLICNFRRCSFSFPLRPFICYGRK